MSKIEKLEALIDEYKKVFADKEIVPGTGDINARLMLIGEAPGRDEIRLSTPFVGIAGKNLEEFLYVLGQKRSEIYITNSIKYRLARMNSQSGRISNRPATRDEIFNNRELLLKEISIIEPEYIVTLGNVPLKAVTGDYGASIGILHGRLETLPIGDRDYNLFPLYHPASIIYNNKLKDIYIKDIQILSDVISNLLPQNNNKKQEN